MRPGSHHFIFYTFNDDTPNFIVPNGQEFRDLYDENGNVNNATVISMGYHKFVSGHSGPGWTMSSHQVLH